MLEEKIMNNLKYIKKYPSLFRTLISNGKAVQTQLIARKDVEDYNDIKTTVDDLNNILDNLYKGSFHTSCYGQRDSCDYFPVTQVQELLDFAYIASMRIALLRKLAVEGGLAEYDSDGKFVVLEKKDSDD